MRSIYIVLRLLRDGKLSEEAACRAPGLQFDQTLERFLESIRYTPEYSIQIINPKPAEQTKIP